MLTAMEELAREHKIMQRAVAVMDRLVEQLELRHRVETDLLRDLLRFMREFGEHCHHGKEESYLFPYLESKGVPSTGCPLSALRGEHAKSRQLMFDLNSAVAAYIAAPEGARLTLIQVLQSLVALYPAHIWKEDYLLFPMAEKVLSTEDDAVLLQQFAMAEDGLGPNVQDAFERLAEQIEERLDECPQCASAQTLSGNTR